VFSAVPGDDGYIIWLLSTADAAVLDTIGARNPVVSPDQHWLVYRERYPTVVEVVFEQYLLYDLTKSGAANAESPTSRNQRPPGRIVYPITENRVRLDDVIVRPEQRHEFASESFFWSPDSRFIVFGDRVQDNVDIVIIDLSRQEMPAYVHELRTADVCDGPQPDSAIVASARVASAEFGQTQQGLPNVWAHLSFGLARPTLGAICTKTPHLHSGNLRLAEVEKHKLLK
jgi:hypothetical protein